MGSVASRSWGGYGLSQVCLERAGYAQQAAQHGWRKVRQNVLPDFYWKFRKFCRLLRIPSRGRRRASRHPAPLGEVFSSICELVSDLRVIKCSAQSALGSSVWLRLRLRRRGSAGYRQVHFRRGIFVLSGHVILVIRRSSGLNALRDGCVLWWTDMRPVVWRGSIVEVRRRRRRLAAVSPVEIIHRSHVIRYSQRCWR